MKRIMVIGSSAGAGKSTFARSLSKQLDIPVYHLDTLYWKPGWVEEDKEAFRSKQEGIVQADNWIIEGNYSSTFYIRVNRADTIISVHQPLWLCLYRVFKRRVMYHGKSRPDLTHGCNEKIDMAFLLFILKTYRSRKKKHKELIHTFKQANQERSVYVLSGTKEINSFLNTL
ncbi:topology modulation protein [Alkalicoccobacillus porphyridii]|uniref:Topology modulation protein n=1 Tax=Alkalicoccobacillus porphyridii TaxID=2597270 RepID=A0A553ZVX5_9BACI|nr:topology modulation protein [Alkalicoccobacillus porphyridii]TSB45485.1 topology modulation protein [Alkalicoccobacillus porphyridii]